MLSTLPPQAAHASASKEAPAKSARRLLFFKIAMTATILLVGGELVSRGFLMIERKAPPLAGNCVRHAHYPTLRSSGAETAAATRTENSYDILILGASTISDEYGSIGKHLAAGLRERLGRPVRVFNTAVLAHNSRDSLLKHRWLADQHFDLVVVYDGINDTRMNNVPPEMFRDDYSHCQWYQCVNRVDEHPILFQAALPFALCFGADRIGAKLGLVHFVPRGTPRDEWAEYGKVALTRATFQQNLREIVTAGTERGERVAIMTFAYHVPADYSLDSFVAGKLDYQMNPHSCAVEMWGKPEYVIAAVQQQNEAVRELAREHPEAVFVDQERLLPPIGAHYIDCCHFTEAGCVEFTKHLLAALAP